MKHAERRVAIQGGRWATAKRVLAFAAGAWCVLALYVIAAVSLCGVNYPLGRGVLATWFYGLLLMYPYFPHRSKLDLPIALIHAFALYRISQWIWRRRRRSGLTK